MSTATLRGMGVMLFVGVAAGCAGRGQTLSPVHATTPEAIPDDRAAGERFFVLVFGSERTVRVPRYTHTWATVVRTVETPGHGPTVAEVHTISWMPATLDIRPWRFTPEPGRNLELHETLRMAIGNKEHVAMWGPFEIGTEPYRRFLLQKQFIESGRVGYQCIDTAGAGADGTGCDCIHAITDMDPGFDRGYYRLSRFGQAGSRFIVRQLFDRGLTVGENTHPWLEGPLGLCRYPIERREYRDRPRHFGTRRTDSARVE